jgi:succinate dehydrogenase/fumarate reductase flavoprotein subunit
MLVVGELVCRSALKRKETRGLHFREEYPNENKDDWQVNIRIHMAADQKLELEKTPIAGTKN